MAEEIVAKTKSTLIEKRGNTFVLYRN
jgi:RNA-binding protein YhbY